MKKKVIAALVFLLLIIQFFPISTDIPAVDKTSDFLHILGETGSKEGIMLKNACYDCHSDQTKYPSYTRLQPLGWWLRGHVRGGVQKLNFSEWSSYTSKQKNHKLEECVEVLNEGRMPLKSYTWMHPESKLSEADNTLLINFFNNPSAR